MDSAAPADTPSPSRKHPVKTALLTLLVAVLIAVIGLFAWGVRRYDQLVKGGKQVRERYDRLAKALPFEPPKAEAEAAPTAERLERMLAVRRRLIESLSPDLDAAAKRLLQADGAGKVALARSLLEMAPKLQQAALRLADALEADAMSPREYRWLLGTLVATALRRPERFPVGAAYQRLAGKLEGLKEELGEQGAALQPVQSLADIERMYGRHRPSDPRLVERLQADNPLVYALDLVALAAGEEKRP